MTDILILVGLGCCGWGAFKLLRLPVAPLLGTIAVVGTMRILQLPLPDTPGFVTPAVQITLGIYIGTKVTRDTVRELKKLLVPATVISAWALTVIFVFGFLLSRLTWLDSFTAILSSSMGGLPEMMVLALATDADTAVIIMMSTARMLATIAIFPIIFNSWFKLHKQNGSDEGEVTETEANLTLRQAISQQVQTVWSARADIIPLTARSLLTVGIALAGGMLVEAIGVPAGIMVGGMFSVAIATVSGAPVASFNPKLFAPLLVFVGIMVTENFTPETARMLASGSLLAPVLISTTLIFMSSLLVGRIIHKLSGWDMPTSFLAAAPGGFTIMTTLAIKYDKDPFSVSMLHLVRLMAIKAFVPLIFMFLI